MSAVDVALDVPEAGAAAHHGPWALALRRLGRNRGAMASVVVLALVVVTAAAAPFYAEHIAEVDPFESNVSGTTTVDGKEVRVVRAQRVGARVHPDRPDARGPLLPRRRLAGPRRMARLLYGGRTSLVCRRRRAADRADRDRAGARRRLLRRLDRQRDRAAARHRVGVPGLPAGDRALDRAAAAGHQHRAADRRPGVAVAADHHHRPRLHPLRRAPDPRRGDLDPPAGVRRGGDRARAPPTGS